MEALIYIAVSLITMFVIGYLMVIGRINNAFSNADEFTCFCAIAGILWPLTWALISAGYVFRIIKQSL